jgi:hypothetical protein
MMDALPHTPKLYILSLKEVPKPTTMMFRSLLDRTTTGTLAWATAVMENDAARSRTSQCHTSIKWLRST